MALQCIGCSIVSCRPDTISSLLVVILLVGTIQWKFGMPTWSLLQHRCGSISCRLCRKKSHKSEAVIQTLTRNTAKICGPKNSSGTNCIIFRHEIYIFRSNFLIFIFLSIFSFIPLRIFINYLTCSLYWFKKKLTAW